MREINDNIVAFTLIELLVVLSVLSILISLALPGINSLFARIRLSSDVRQIYISFLKARQLAITCQEDYGLSFDIDKKEYTIFSSSNDDIDTKKLRDSVEYTDVALGGDNKMVFKPLGTAEGGHVSLSNMQKNREYKITISGITGRVRYELVKGNN